MQIHQWQRGRWVCISGYRTIAYARQTLLRAEKPTVITNELGLVRDVADHFHLDYMVGTNIKDWPDNAIVPA